MMFNVHLLKNMTHWMWVMWVKYDHIQSIRLHGCLIRILPRLANLMSAKNMVTLPRVANWWELGRTERKVILKSLTFLSPGLVFEAPVLSQSA